MRESRFTQDQITKIFREADRALVADVARKNGVSEQALYVWRKRYGQLEAADADTSATPMLPDDAAEKPRRSCCNGERRATGLRRPPRHDEMRDCSSLGDAYSR